jgi:hypothetical protein
MEGSVLSFLKAEWKVSDTGSAHWASSFNNKQIIQCVATGILSLLFYDIF